MWLKLACLSAVGAYALPGAAEVAGSFGIVTDVHYADADPGGSRHYRDGIPKMKEATAAISAAGVDFLIELGDFKDTNPQKNVSDTLAFLDQIESSVHAYTGPIFHVLGNHDVDVLNQTQVMDHVKNFGQPDSKSYYSFDDLATNGSYVQSDTVGCLVHGGSSASNVWLVHNDSTRNWISAPTPGCFADSLSVPDIDVYTKRYGPTDPRYNLNAAQSKAACDTNKACTTIPPAAVGVGGLHYVVLNGDFTADGEAWYDIDSQGTKFSWSNPWVPSAQMEWLQEDLAQVCCERVYCERVCFGRVYCERVYCERVCFGRVCCGRVYCERVCFERVYCKDSVL
jgi:hypothetical protein